jgi:GTPase Era involved in 16S rRNA processing
VLSINIFILEDMERINKNGSEKKEAASGREGDEIKPDLEKLTLYKHLKLALADQLRIIRRGMAALGREAGEKQCDDLMVKLAEDRFTLAVLGQFKRGKSSLMNAIIGHALLPTGVLPLTSVITKLIYGPSERMLVNHSYSIFPDEQPVALLPDYVTEKGNPGNTKKVANVTLELPVPFLQKGLEFVDTPGIGSAIAANTKTTYDFLPDCDAVLFVTGADTPMTSMEIAFLKEIALYVNKLFFIINKIDLVTEAEQAELIEFVAETIRSQTGYSDVKVYPVSSSLGLKARENHDTDIYQASGFKALKDALTSFLTGEKTEAFLGAVADKILRMIDDENAQGIFHKGALQSRSETLKEKISDRLSNDPYAAASEIKEAYQKVEKLYHEIHKGRATVARDAELPAAALDLPENTAAIASSAMDQVDITADLQARDCPVCRHMMKQSFDFYAQWQYLLATDEKSQKEFAAELGFCPLHTWQLLAVSSPYGASIGYARLAEQIAHRIREGNLTNTGRNTVDQLVHELWNCPVCKLLQKAEESYIKQLAAMISGTDGQNKYNRSEGVCLRHLGMLLHAVNLESLDFLLFHAVSHFEQDAEDMRAYAMKRDALRRELLSHSEKDAYRRTMIRIVGNRDVCTPWSEDREI